MDNQQSSEIITDNQAQDAIAHEETPEIIVESQPVLITSPDDSFTLKKIAIFCAAGVLALSVFFIFAKGTDVCLAINCNSYSDSVSSSAMGTDFVAYAGGAASLLVLTATGMSILPAVAISTGIWFAIQMIR
ncbi:MAG: hypothetical protein AAFQ80_11210 [Cyanobacteria bacterium J06621_8]